MAEMGLFRRMMAAIVPSTTASYPPGVAGPGAMGLEAGSQARRLRNFQPGPAHVNSLISAAGNTVTQRARWLARNNGYAINALDWWGNTVVGPGISPSWLRLAPDQKKAMRSAWDDWTDEADAEGLTDFYGLQRRAARELFIAGEVFIRLRYRRPEDGLSVPLQLQMLPSEMLDANDNRPWSGGVMVRQGVEFDRLGRRTAYWFWRRHPADSTELRCRKSNLPPARLPPECRGSVQLSAKPVTRFRTSLPRSAWAATPFRHSASKVRSCWECSAPAALLPARFSCSGPWSRRCWAPGMLPGSSRRR